MAMVDVRDVRLAVRRQFLTTTGLPTAIQYEGQILDSMPSDAVAIIESTVPVEQFPVAFGTSMATGMQIYEVVAPASRPDLINSAYDTAHSILESFEHGRPFTDVDGTYFQVIRSYLADTGRRTSDESDLYFVPVIVMWRSFSTLA